MVTYVRAQHGVEVKVADEEVKLVLDRRFQGKIGPLVCQHPTLQCRGTCFELPCLESDTETTKIPNLAMVVLHLHARSFASFAAALLLLPSSERAPCLRIMCALRWSELVHKWRS